MGKGQVRLNQSLLINGWFIPLSFGAPTPHSASHVGKVPGSRLGAELTVSGSRFHSRFVSCFTDQ